jgi:transposase-like protein
MHFTRKAMGLVKRQNRKEIGGDLKKIFTAEDVAKPKRA